MLYWNVWLERKGNLNTSLQTVLGLKMSRLMTKPTNWHVRPAKTQISLGICPVWSESSLSAWRKLGSLATHWAYSEDWSDWADAQADLSLRWAHSHSIGFVVRGLKSWLQPWKKSLSWKYQFWESMYPRLFHARKRNNTHTTISKSTLRTKCINWGKWIIAKSTCNKQHPNATEFWLRLGWNWSTFNFNEEMRNFLVEILHWKDLSVVCFCDSA